MINGYRNWVLVGTIMKMNKGKEKGKMLNVIVKDLAGDNSYYLKLSEEQYRLLEWLVKEDILVDVRVEKFEGYEFKKI